MYALVGGWKNVVVAVRRSYTTMSDMKHSINLSAYQDYHSNEHFCKPRYHFEGKLRVCCAIVCACLKRKLLINNAGAILALAMPFSPTINELLAGSLAGAAQVLVGQPLDTIKTRAQIAPSSVHVHVPVTSISTYHCIKRGCL